MAPLWKKLPGLRGILRTASEDGSPLAGELAGGFTAEDEGQGIENTDDYNPRKTNTMTDDDGTVWNRVK